MKEEFLLCSECFEDEGLRFNAKKIGKQINNVCPHCKSKNGVKLSYENILELCNKFYVIGTIYKDKYSEAPILQVTINNGQEKRGNIDVEEWGKKDLELLKQYGNVNIDYNAPRMWLLGQNDILLDLQNSKKRKIIIENILQTYPIKYLDENEKIYRVRLNPKYPSRKEEYDTPPCKSKNFGRFDSINFPVFYGSQDLETCIHECRTSIEDNIFVATFKPKKVLKILDLTEIIDDNKTEFESIDIAIYFLFLAGKYSYNISRQIAQIAKSKGIDGIIYPSYFSNLKTGAISRDTWYGISIRKLKEFKIYNQNLNVPNIALFGFPIKENKLELSCINEIIMKKMSYDLILGTVMKEN